MAFSQAPPPTPASKGLKETILDSQVRLRNVSPSNGDVFHSKLSLIDYESYILKVGQEFDQKDFLSEVAKATLDRNFKEQLQQLTQQFQTKVFKVAIVNEYELKRLIDDVTECAKNIEYLAETYIVDEEASKLEEDAWNKKLAKIIFNSSRILQRLDAKKALNSESNPLENILKEETRVRSPVPEPDIDQDLEMEFENYMLYINNFITQHQQKINSQFSKETVGDHVKKIIHKVASDVSEIYKKAEQERIKKEKEKEKQKKKPLLESLQKMPSRQTIQLQNEMQQTLKATMTIKRESESREKQKQKILAVPEFESRGIQVNIRFLGDPTEQQQPQQQMLPKIMQTSQYSQTTEDLEPPQVMIVESPRHKNSRSNLTDLQSKQNIFDCEDEDDDDDDSEVDEKLNKVFQQDRDDAGHKKQKTRLVQDNSLLEIQKSNIELTSQYEQQQLRNAELEKNLQSLQKQLKTLAEQSLGYQMKINLQEKQVSEMQEKSKEDLKIQNQKIKSYEDDIKKLNKSSKLLQEDLDKKLKEINKLSKQNNPDQPKQSNNKAVVKKQTIKKDAPTSQPQIKPQQEQEVIQQPQKCDRCEQLEQQLLYWRNIALTKPPETQASKPQFEDEHNEAKEFQDQYTQTPTLDQLFTKKKGQNSSEQRETFNPVEISPTKSAATKYPQTPNYSKRNPVNANFDPILGQSDLSNLDNQNQGNLKGDTYGQNAGENDLGKVQAGQDKFYQAARKLMTQNQSRLGQNLQRQVSQQDPNIFLKGNFQDQVNQQNEPQQNYLPPKPKQLRSMWKRAKQPQNVDSAKQQDQKQVFPISDFPIQNQQSKQ